MQLQYNKETNNMENICSSKHWQIQDQIKIDDKTLSLLSQNIGENGTEQLGGVK